MEQKNEKKQTVSLPLIITFVVLCVVLPILVFGYYKFVIKGIRATTDIEPTNIRIVDISANSIGITWHTNTPTTGYVKYSQSPGSLTNTASDERGSDGKYYSHYCVLRNLVPNSKVYFSIVSEGKEFNNQGNPYQQQTMGVLEPPATLEDIRGILKGSDGNTIGDAIVYLTLVGKTQDRPIVSQTLGTVTNNSGAWVFKLGIRTVDGSSYISDFQNYYAKIETLSPDGTQGYVIGNITENFGIVLANTQKDDMPVVSGSGGGGGTPPPPTPLLAGSYFITNITDGSFTVVWETEKPTKGAIKYGINSQTLSNTAYDTRGQDRYLYTHSVTIVDTASDPGTTYYFKIGVDDKLLDDNGKPFIFKKPLQSGVPRTDPIEGTLSSTTGELDDSVVLAQATINGNKTTYISSIPLPNGNWQLELGYLRSTENNGEIGDYIHYSETDKLKIEIKGVSKIDGSLTEKTVAELKNSNLTLAVSLKTKEGAQYACQPLNLQSESRIRAGTPIGGCGLKPNTTIKLKIESPKVVTAEVMTDSQGRWSWTIPKNLSEGWHTITATIMLADGSIQTITRRVYISGATPQTALGYPVIYVIDITIILIGFYILYCIKEETAHEKWTKGILAIFETE
uniref:Fibronectin type-III domain-containing protein n=1 Tax=candidate division CPR3 bacterium TaxID=2268181 RepID=A0A7C5YXS3_UNCC3